MHILTVALAIFLWMYLMPIMLLGALLAGPILLWLSPIIVALSAMGIFASRDDVRSSALRDIANALPYYRWFGKVDRVPTVDSPHLITFHPHGVLCTAALTSAHFKPGSDTLFAVSRWLFVIPGIGWIAVQLGCIPATQARIEAALQHGSVVLVPGGVPELVVDRPYTRRYGFLRCALRAKVPLLPVHCGVKFFDRIDTPSIQDVQLWIARHIGLPVMLPVFGWHALWLPKRLPVNVDIKKAIVVRHEASLEQERVRYFRHVYGVE